MKSAVIIGASQGVGVSLANKLYQNGYKVVIVARTETKLKSVKESITSTDDVRYISCDVSNYSQCEKMWQTIDEYGVDPNYIFCCVGSSIPKLFTDLTPEDISMGIDTNYKAVINSIHTGVKQFSMFSEFKARRIVLFLSILGYFPFLGYGQYAPMKAAIESLSTILRQELLPYNIKVSCVFAGNFASEGYEQENLTKPEITKNIEGSSKSISCDECADIILKKIDRNYDTITTDFIGWLLGCASLGFRPREWWLPQIVVGPFMMTIAPIVNWSIKREIVSYFKYKKDKSDSTKSD